MTITEKIIACASIPALAALWITSMIGLIAFLLMQAIMNRLDRQGFAHVATERDSHNSGLLR